MGKKTIRVRPHEDFVGMQMFGQEVPLCQSKIGKRIHPEEKNPTRAKHPDHFSQNLRGIIDVIQYVETNDQRKLACGKRQRLAGRSGKTKRTAP